MSIQFVCDFCGEPIVHDATHHVLSADRDGHRFRREWTGHYHDGHCWDAIEDAIEDAIDGATSSARTPRREGEPEAHAPARPAATHDERDCWKRLPRHAKERHVYAVLGEDAFPIKDIQDRLRQANPGYTIYGVESFIARMWRDGELDRRRVPWRGNQQRWAYFRNTELTGPIAELQRQLDEHDGTTTTGGEGNG